MDIYDLEMKIRHASGPMALWRTGERVGAEHVSESGETVKRAGETPALRKASLRSAPGKKAVALHASSGQEEDRSQG